MSSTVHPEDEETLIAYKVQYDSNGFPKTLLDWRREPRNAFWTARYALSHEPACPHAYHLALEIDVVASHLWDPLEGFFESKGYTLFVSTKKWQCCLTPKDESKERSPDMYHHVLPDDQRAFLGKHVHHVSRLLHFSR